LRPGSTPGTADLLVNLTPGPGTSASVEMDNQGNHYTGAYRLGTALYVNEPLGWGDVASARLLTSGEGLSFGRVAYQMPAAAFTVGLAASSLHYQLGGAFTSLQSSGTAQTGTVFASYPLVRARRQNLSAQWSMDYKEFEDRTGAGSPSRNTKNAQVHTVGLKGNFQDAQGSSSGHYALSWAHGTINLHDATTRSNDASSAQSNGTYDKVAYGLTRQQTLFTGTDLYVSVNGQWSSKNLDASEKFSLGGGTGVRAYPAGEASGDQGAIFTLETRTNISGLFNWLPGQLQWIGFVDIGSVNINRSPWDALSTNSRELRSAGLGLNWIGPSNLFMKAYWAFKLGDAAATSAPDASGRFWLQIIQAF
jgi:hemolysin activation/secretion protein